MKDYTQENRTVALLTVNASMQTEILIVKPPVVQSGYTEKLQLIKSYENNDFEINGI